MPIKVMEETIERFIDFASVAVPVEQTYEYAFRIVRARVSDFDVSKYDELQLKTSIWRQVLFMQCVIVRQSKALTDAEESAAIERLTTKRSMERPPSLKR